MQRALPLLSLALALHGAPVAATSSDENMALSGDAQARLETTGGNLYLATTSRSYELTQFVERGLVHTAVVETEVRHRQRVSEDLGDSGDETGTVTLRVHPLSHSGRLGPPLAQRSLPGDEVHIQGAAGAEVRLWGCCAEGEARMQLNLSTLKTLYVRSDGPPLLTYTRLGKPSAIGRILAVYLAITAADEQVLGKDPAAVALITWASDDKTLQRVLVRLGGDHPRDAAMDWSVTLGWKLGNAPLDSHVVVDPSKPGTPLLVWQIDDAQAIQIPLVGDRLELASAKLPKGVSLAELPR